MRLEHRRGKGPCLRHGHLVFSLQTPSHFHSSRSLLTCWVMEAAAPPTKAQLEQVTHFGLVVSNPSDKQRASLDAQVRNLLRLYEVLRNAGWPARIAGPPPASDPSDVTFDRTEGIVTNEPWGATVYTSVMALAAVHDAYEGMGRGFHVPGLLPAERSTFNAEYPADRRPALKIGIGALSKSARRAANIRQEEMQRLALSWIYNRPLPVECVAAVFSARIANHFLFDLMLTYCKAIGILVKAVEVKGDMGGRIDPLRIAESVRSQVKTHVDTFIREHAKAERHGLLSRNLIAGNIAAGRAATEGAAFRFVPPKRPCTGSCEPARVWEPQALFDSLAALTSICSYLKYDLATALREPDAFLNFVNARMAGLSSRQSLGPHQPRTDVPRALTRALGMVEQPMAGVGTTTKMATAAAGMPPGSTTDPEAATGGGTIAGSRKRSRPLTTPVQKAPRAGAFSASSDAILP